MKKLVKVRLLVDTGRNKAGDVRKLNPERAEAWVKAGWWNAPVEFYLIHREGS